MVSESPEIHPLLVEALAALSERKTLLNYTMDELCMVRKGVVSRGFIDALTRGSSASGPTNTSVKPIEMHAHDPVRYIGDMLAWIHQVSLHFHFPAKLEQSNTIPPRGKRSTYKFFINRELDFFPRK